MKVTPLLKQAVDFKTPKSVRIKIQAPSSSELELLHEKGAGTRRSGFAEGPSSSFKAGKVVHWHKLMRRDTTMIALFVYLGRLNLRGPDRLVSMQSEIRL